MTRAAGGGFPRGRFDFFDCRPMLGYHLGDAAVLRALVILIALMAPNLAVAEESLYDAALKGDTASIERLLTGGTAVDALGPDRATPLIGAALGGHAEAAKMLLAKGADVMARNSGGFTALHAAAYAGSLPVAELLLDNKAARDDAANKAGVTPLFVAAETNHPEFVELMVAKGADIKGREAHGYSPLTRAFWKGHKDMIRLLKRHGLECESPPLGPAEMPQCLAIKD